MYDACHHRHHLYPLFARISGHPRDEFPSGVFHRGDTEQVAAYLQYWRGRKRHSQEQVGLMGWWRDFLNGKNRDTSDEVVKMRFAWAVLYDFSSCFQGFFIKQRLQFEEKTRNSGHALHRAHRWMITRKPRPKWVRFRREPRKQSRRNW